MRTVVLLKVESLDFFLYLVTIIESSMEEVQQDAFSSEDLAAGIVFLMHHDSRLASSRLEDTALVPSSL